MYKHLDEDLKQLDTSAGEHLKLQLLNFAKLTSLYSAFTVMVKGPV